MSTEFKQKCEKTIDVFQVDLHKIRTGRAHPSFLDQVTVPYYGTDTPLSQVANVTNEDATTLNITPWEVQMVQVVGKAIDESNLGVKANVSADKVRVNMPMLTSERRQELIKVVKADAEKARVAIRQHRRVYLQLLKRNESEGLVTEDELHREEVGIQKLTDEYISRIDSRLQIKQKELEEI